jgi:hypothetical protein
MYLINYLFQRIESYHFFLINNHINNHSNSNFGKRDLNSSKSHQQQQVKKLAENLEKKVILMAWIFDIEHVPTPIGTLEIVFVSTYHRYLPIEKHRQPRSRIFIP